MMKHCLDTLENQPKGSRFIIHIITLGKSRIGKLS